MRNSMKKFAGKRFELVDETNDFEEAQQQAKKLRDSGHLARVEVRRYLWFHRLFVDTNLVDQT